MLRINKGTQGQFWGGRGYPDMCSWTRPLTTHEEATLLPSASVPPPAFPDTEAMGAAEMDATDWWEATQEQSDAATAAAAAAEAEGF